MRERRRGGTGAVALVALLLLTALPLGLGGGAVPTAGAALGGARAQPMTAPAPTNNVSYNSTVDGYPLSYLEWLPAGFSGSGSYPLAVFLHGVGSTSTWVRGGEGGLVDVTPSLVENASDYGFVLIAINTRSSDGFYVDSPCGGPQQQDVLDAIAHEQRLRSISSVYFIGFSMGSLGSFSIAGHHAGLVRGIATAGTITDIYETIAYNRLTRSDPSGLYDAECGDYPGPGNTTTDAVWTSLSVMRFDPQNFSGIALFVSGGGDDTRAPNNFARWPYANVNSTFVNSTCVVATALGEPADCTVTIPSLAQQEPSAYRWLDLYEPDAPHNTAQLPGGAVFSFFLGRTAGGYYVSTYPGDVLTPYTLGTPIHVGRSPPPPLLTAVDLYLFLGVAVAVIVVAVALVVARTRRRP